MMLVVWFVFVPGVSMDRRGAFQTPPPFTTMVWVGFWLVDPNLDVAWIPGFTFRGG